MEGVGPDGLDNLRRRMMMKAIMPATLPRKTTPPTTPPAMAPALDDFLLGTPEVEEVGLARMLVVELPVA